jgi:hypothetical protein
MKKQTMKKISFLISAIVGVIIAVSCGNQNELKPNSTATISNDSLIKIGEYLVNTIGCDDCHSPKIMGPKGPEVDMSLRFSGHPANVPLAKISSESKSWILFNPSLTAFVGPWGTSFSANITSHETGIGKWTEQQFFKAMREGKSKGLDGGRPILPPMPWYNFAKLKDNDLKAIYLYLKSTKAIENKVPAHVPPAQLTSL